MRRSLSSRTATTRIGGAGDVARDEMLLWDVNPSALDLLGFADVAAPVAAAIRRDHLDCGQWPARTGCSSTRPRLPGLQVEATTSAVAARVAVVVGARLPGRRSCSPIRRPRRPGMRPGRLRGGRRQAPSQHRRRRRCPVDVDAGRTNTDRRRSRRWLGAASQQRRRAAARPLPPHASSAWLGRTDLSGGHHRQGTACGLVRPRRGDVDHPRQVRRQETQARS